MLLRTFNAGVAGSSPAFPTNKNTHGKVAQRVEHVQFIFCFLPCLKI